MILTDLIAEIESLYPWVEGLPTNVCQTGEPYLVFRACGIERREGYQCSKPFRGTEEEAVAGLRRHVLNYAKRHKGTLYWRSVPETQDRGARARLVMTDKPMIYPTIEALDARRKSA